MIFCEHSGIDECCFTDIMGGGEGVLKVFWN